MNFKTWLENKEILNEVDWDDTFSDVKKQCIDTKELVKYLNDVKKQASIKYGKRKKFPASLPFVHSKSSFFNKSEEEVDIDYFIKKITEHPKTVINTNEKILKSGSPNEFVYKTGIPAFRGIAYDIENEKFVFINTCPGADKCVIICYARKGRYIQYPNSYDSMTKRLNLLLNYPDEYERRLYKEIKEKAKEHKALAGYKPKVILRWNDSGDFFTKKYIQIAEDVINKLQKEGFNVFNYAYTKIKDMESDLIQTTKSAQPDSLASEKNEKISLIIPKKLFKDLNFLKIDDEKELKIRVSKHFRLPYNMILSYDQMKTMPEGEIPKWNIIVTPDDGDDAAFRKDVKRILLTEH